MRPVRPKLLFYVPGLVDGGAERLWASLATALYRLGYPVVFAVDFEAADNRHQLDPGIALTVLGQGHKAQTLRLAQLLREERPDVALSAVAGSNTKLLLALAMARTPTRPILSFQGANEHKTGLLSLLTFLSIPLSTRIAPRTVAVSHGLRRLLISRWRASARRTVALPNPVFLPPDVPVPDAATLAAREPVVLAVGRLVDDKDYPTLIRAMARVRTPGARLVILGKGPREREIRDEIARLKLGDRVTLAGYSRDPWEYYRSAKCFAISSQSEQFGNVVVEALAHGLPVVTTASVGPSEILDDRPELGRIVDVGDAVALADALDAMLTHPGDPGVRRTRADEFSFAARLPGYEAVIADVMAGRSPADGPS